MNAVIEVLYLRRPRLEYISPPACEFDFSSTGGPIIVLEALGRLLAPSGFVLSGKGRFILSWNNYPGALCYTVYHAVDPNNPFGEYVIIEECIEEPTIDLTDTGGGCFRVSAITENGETELSEPICGVGDCPFILSGATPVEQTVDQGETISISCEIANPEMVTSYVWYKDGVPFSDTTGTTQEQLVIPNANATHQGEYFLVINGNGCTDQSDSAEVLVGDTPPCSESIEIVGISTLADLAENGTIIGTQSSRPFYHAEGITKDIRTDVDSSPITGSQLGTTITASANFFSATDVGKFVIFSTLEEAEITAFISPLQVTVTPSQSVPSTTFLLRGNTLGGNVGQGLLANSAGILSGLEDNFSSISQGFWLNLNTNNIRALGNNHVPIALSADNYLLISDSSVAPVRARLYNPNDQTQTDFGDLDGSGASVQAEDMNDSHVATVTLETTLGSGIFHAARGTVGSLVDIHPAVAVGTDSFARVINSSGNAAGLYIEPVTLITKTFVNLGGASVSIGGFGGEVEVIAMSDNNIIVGEAETGMGTGIFRPFFWTLADGIQFIPLLSGKTNGIARGVNSAGWIVGNMTPSSVGFIYRGGITTSLLDLVPSGFGWTAIATAEFINEAGQIIGRGTNSGTKRYLLQLCS